MAATATKIKSDATRMPHAKAKRLAKGLNAARWNGECFTLECEAVGAWLIRHEKANPDGSFETLAFVVLT